MNHRLGLDFGTNSLGWAVLELGQQGEPCAIEAAGSRIFADGRKPRENTTLDAERREARSVCRRRDRYLQRRKFLLNELTNIGLFPEAEDEAARKTLQQLNPPESRAHLLTKKAADILANLKTRTDKAGEAIGPANIRPEHLIGRVLFHLNQRGGFQSNRKDRSEETVSGKVSDTVRMLMEEMKLIALRTPDEGLSKEEYNKLSREEKRRVREERKQARQEQEEVQARKDALLKLAEQKDLSFGSFLYERYKKKQQTRARPSAGNDGKLYDVYPRKVHISPTGQVNYETRYETQRRKRRKG